MLSLSEPVRPGHKEADMASKCSDYSVKGCPASYYLKCRAYAEGLNCWDLVSVPCCSKANLTECRDCEIYKKWKSVQANDLKMTAIQADFNGKRS